MKILWVEFAPLFLPLHRRIETLWTLAYIISWMLVGPVCACFIIWALLYSPNFRFPCIAYLTWMYYDRKSPENGIRISAAAKDWYWWKQVKNYFPISLEKTADLSPDKSYLVVSCPHGLINTAGVIGLGTNACGSSEKFPGLSIYIGTIPYLCALPVIREITLSIGATMASEKSMVKILSNKGNAIMLYVGGTAEAYLANPGSYRTIIGRRKGFVRVAFKAGASLVPTYNFGETEVYSQLEFQPGSLLKRVQDTFKDKFGAGFVIGTGRGIFQYTFGLMPRRHPLHAVVGKPIHLPKVENPSKEQIDDIHKIFCRELKELFDREKSKYVKNYENVNLEFV